MVVKVQSRLPDFVSLTRPRTLPPKSADEEARHRQMHERLMAESRARDEKLKRERDQRNATALQFWTEIVLPNWPRDQNHARTIRMSWQGIPASVRCKAWLLALGNSLQITPAVYLDCQRRGAAKAFPDDQISLDLPRTFAQLSFFQGSRQVACMRNVLDAFVGFRPELGYVQGMSYVCGMCLMYLEEFDAFVALAHILSRPLLLSFYTMDVARIAKVSEVLDSLLKAQNPALYAHFQSHNVRWDCFLLDWTMTLFAKALPVETAARVWDAFCFEGETAFYRICIGLLCQQSADLLALSFEHIVRRLTRLADAPVHHEALFSAVEKVPPVNASQLPPGPANGRPTPVPVQSFTPKSGSPSSASPVQPRSRASSTSEGTASAAPASAALAVPPNRSSGGGSNSPLSRSDGAAASSSGAHSSAVQATEVAGPPAPTTEVSSAVS
jgi:hypothetical protein